MADVTFTDEQLALVLQTSRDFAFQQIAAGMPMLPFATCVKTDGAMDFVRFAEPDTDMSPHEVLDLTTREVAQEAARGGIIAAAIVSAVRLAQPEDGTQDAIRVHVEAPGFSRQVLALYSLEPGEAGEAASVSPGKIVPFDSEQAIFDS